MWVEYPIISYYITWHIPINIIIFPYISHIFPIYFPSWLYYKWYSHGIFRSSLHLAEDSLGTPTTATRRTQRTRRRGPFWTASLRTRSSTESLERPSRWDNLRNGSFDGRECETLGYLMVLALSFKWEIWRTCDWLEGNFSGDHCFSMYILWNSCGFHRFPPCFFLQTNPVISNYLIKVVSGS